MKSIALSFLFSLLVFNSFGKDGEQPAIPHKKKPRTPPSALLVELHTEGNRTKTLQKQGDQLRLKKLRKDSEKIMAVTINDFQSNFKCRPVYYFYDTSEARIKDQDFNGVLMDANKNIITASPIAAGDTSYLIAYYGHPMSDTATLPASISDSDDIYSPEMLQYSKVYGAPYGSSKSYSLGTGLVVVDYKFRETRKTRRFYIGGNRDLNIFIGVFRSPKYNFSSSDFEIDYVQSAKRLNTAFNEYFRLKM